MVNRVKRSATVPVREPTRDLAVVGSRANSVRESARSGSDRKSRNDTNRSKNNNKSDRSNNNNTNNNNIGNNKVDQSNRRRVSVSEERQPEVKVSSVLKSNRSRPSVKSEGGRLLTHRTEQKKLVFKVDDLAPNCIRRILLERGWVEHVSGATGAGSVEGEGKDLWHLYWKAAKFSGSDYDFLLSWQVINHFPKTFNIAQKDCLARNLKRMRAVYGQSLFDFFPRTYILPNDYPKLIDQYIENDRWTSYIRQQMSRSAKFSAKARSASGGSRGGSAASGDGKSAKDTSGSENIKLNPKKRKPIWITKPAQNSQGKGIKILDDLAELRFDSATVVQKYIENPMLISGYKFDLRLYVVIASFHPLTVYLYKEGLVRFATDKFSMDNLTNVYSHLTNTSINKSSPTYSKTKEHVGPGCIWALSQLKSYFESQVTSEFKGDRLPAFTWHKITNIITLTLLGLSDHIPTQAYNCFELLGFDILIDKNMKPWLLEVNVSPALTTDTPLDAYVKLGVLQHTVYLVEKLFFGELEEEINKKKNLSRKRGDNSSVAYKATASLTSSKSLPAGYHASGFYKPRVGIFSRSRTSKALPSALGDLRLIFPFNEASRLATCFEKHDIRTAILEISKRDSFVQRKLQTWSARRRGPNQTKLDNLLLWCP